MTIGTICTWRPDRGFGFIMPDDGTRDVFLHVSTLIMAAINEDDIRVGSRLQFDTKPDRKGRPAGQAFNVKLLDR